ncbi:ANKRD10 [Symbiodinium sp. CCMP2456]|nr:ANKRD10 [Symbiodinium sp. CCMP2456]
MFQAGWSLCLLAQAAAAGQLHDQTALKAAGVSAPRGLAPLSDVPDEELLADGEGAENTAHLLKPQVPPQGLALLKEDLQWLRDITFSAIGQPPFPWTLVSFCLSWLTVLASAGLVRSLLSDRQLSPSKCVDDLQEPGESGEPEEEEAPNIPPPKPAPDMTSAVLLQRATEKEEEAQRRAVHIRTGQKDHGDVFGCSALHVAAHNGHSEDVAELLSAGFDVNAEDHFGETPLHMVARSGCLDTATLLLGHGADKTRRNCNGLTPSAVAMLHDKSFAAMLGTGS